jgi:uncharacterized protein YlaI
MWQIPSDEINRPGSFSSHARKNLELLVCVLCELEDTQTLLLLAQCLRSKPDVTKQYLRDNERVAMHTKVRSMRGRFSLFPLPCMFFPYLSLSSLPSLLTPSSSFPPASLPPHSLLPSLPSLLPPSPSGGEAVCSIAGEGK